MAKIILQRTSEYVNRMRDYKIYLDGLKIGTIANGETKQFEINTGQHSIIAKIDWCCSPEINTTFSENETKSLKVGGFKNGNWIMPVGLILIVIVLFLDKYFDNLWALLLELPPFAILVYYLTIGRRNYLTLTEF